MSISISRTLELELLSTIRQERTVISHLSEEFVHSDHFDRQESPEIEDTQSDHVEQEDYSPRVDSTRSDQGDLPHTHIEARTPEVTKAIYRTHT